jgi:hypothetical protein
MFPILKEKNLLVSASFANLIAILLFKIIQFIFPDKIINLFISQLLSSEI